MSNAIKMPNDRRQLCTCKGECLGEQSLGAGWVCELEVMKRETHDEEQYFRVRPTKAATYEEIVLGACVLLRAGELKYADIQKIESALDDAKARRTDSGVIQ